MTRFRARLALPAVAVLGVLAGAVGGSTASGSGSAVSSPTATAIAAGMNNPNLDLGSSLGSLPAPDIRLTNQFGQPMSLSQFRGKVVMLSFEDSECTTVCPLTTQSMLEAKQLLGAAGDIGGRALGPDRPLLPAQPRHHAELPRRARHHGAGGGWLPGSGPALVRPGLRVRQDRLVPRRLATPIRPRIRRQARRQSPGIAQSAEHILVASVSSSPARCRDRVFLVHNGVLVLRGEFSRWIRAWRWIRCTGMHPIHRGTRIRHDKRTVLRAICRLYTQ